jgi:hypothetical protein
VEEVVQEEETLSGCLLPDGQWKYFLWYDQFRQWVPVEADLPAEDDRSNAGRLVEYGTIVSEESIESYGFYEFTPEGWFKWPRGGDGVGPSNRFAGMGGASREEVPRPAPPDGDPQRRLSGQEDGGEDEA